MVCQALQPALGGEGSEDPIVKQAVEVPHGPLVRPHGSSIECMFDTLKFVRFPGRQLRY